MMQAFHSDDILGALVAIVKFLNIFLVNHYVSSAINENDRHV